MSIKSISLFPVQSYTIIHQSLPSEQGKTNRKKLKISENLLSSNLPLLPALEGEEPNSTLTRSKNLSIILDELESSQNVGYILNNIYPLTAL